MKTHSALIALIFTLISSSAFAQTSPNKKLTTDVETTISRVLELVGYANKIDILMESGCEDKTRVKVKDMPTDELMKLVLKEVDCSFSEVAPKIFIVSQNKKTQWASSPESVYARVFLFNTLRRQTLQRFSKPNSRLREK